MESKSNFNAPSASDTPNFSADKYPQNKVATAAHEVVDKLTSAADQATRNIKPAIDGVVDAAHKTVDKAAEVAGSAAEWASEKTADVQDGGKQLFEDSCAYIAAQPVKSLAIALLAGIVIGKAIRSH
jgi:ElaB/YqjD/DUF883 family membrane-anchored ribosome-binding protein